MAGRCKLLPTSGDHRFRYAPVTDRQTDRQTDRRTDRQSERERERERESESESERAGERERERAFVYVEREWVRVLGRVRIP